MTRTVMFVVVVLALVTVSTASQSGRVPLYTRTGLPEGWTQAAKADAVSPVVFTLALTQRNLDVLEKIALDVSNPQAPDYQAFLTKGEILSIVAPTVATQEHIVAVLVAAGVAPDSINNLGDAIDVKTSVAVASALFETTFFEFQHTKTQKTVIRSWGSYSLPSELHGVVDFVAGLSTFPIPHLDAKRHFRDSVRGSAGAGDLLVIPQTYTAMYNIPPTQYANATGNPLLSQGLIEFEAQTYDKEQYAQYGSDLQIQVIAIGDNTTVGPEIDQPQIEAQLDVEAMGGINNEATMWFWLEPGTGWQYTFATHFFSTSPNIPTVASMSYAWSELDQCENGIGGAECSTLGINSLQYVTRVNAEYMKIATLGVSVFSASGDSGANGRTNSQCSQPLLKPDFPASSPWITSVGGTQLINAAPLATQYPVCAPNCAGIGSEVAVSFAVANFESGGGFSWSAPMPSWQTSAVSNYLFTQKANLPPASYFNASGRGFPDVAAIGHNFLINAGSYEPVGGTSVSTPVVAAMFAMFNQVAVAKSGKPLGFVSPLLYQMYAADPTIFQDITVGSNKCTEGGCNANCQGYVCAPGWDPVTGLGTLNFQKAEAFIGKMFDARNQK